METQLLLGDCLDQLKNIKDNTIDSIVTDPPYGLSFMGKKWDYDVPSTEIWEECIRVLKPGGHLLSFAGSRTYHRMAVRIEDAGFEIRDQIMWIYGSGFPKSHNIGKAVDKIEGNEREVVGENLNVRKADSQKNTILEGGFKEDNTITKGNSDWEGWGTALKPAHEPIVMARKPLEGTVANNVLEWGVGGINIDGCRVAPDDAFVKHIEKYSDRDVGVNGIPNSMFGNTHGKMVYGNVEGRFPANIILDEEAGKILDEQSGITSQGHWPKGKVKGFGEFGGGESSYEGVGPKDKEKGGASRFFYCPKASKKDRDEGVEYVGQVVKGRDEGQDAMNNPYKLRPAIGATYAGNQTTSKIGANPNKPTEPRANIHPTVKPTDLMQYLIRLVTPKGGVVLDPFTGSGSTGKAAVREGMQFIGIEREEEYFEIAKQRIEWEVKKKPNNKFWD